MKYLRAGVIVGNVLFVLWIFWTAFHHGFVAVTTFDALSLVGLAVLLALNLVLIAREK